MHRRLAYAFAAVLASAFSARAVDLTGDWVSCGDCRIDGAFGHSCDIGPSTTVSPLAITQTGTNLSINSILGTSTGTIDPVTGLFNVPNGGLRFSGIGTNHSIDASFDSTFQQGRTVASRACDPMAPACDDGDSCTDDTCVTATIGTCTSDPVQNYCTNTQNGSCTTTTTSSTTTTTMPLGQHPMTGQKLVIERNSKGRQTLIFVTKDPLAYVPTVGAFDDPSLLTTQIHLYAPVADGGPNLTIPPGIGKPGWFVKPVPGPQYKFTNSAAPEGISVVRTMKLRAGKGYKIVARATGFPMNQPLGSVGISISWSGSTACAHFGAASVRKDTPPEFIAGASPAPLNCNVPTLRAP